MSKAIHKCPKCGELQKSYKKTENWEYFKCGEKCVFCNVEFQVFVEG